MSQKDIIVLVTGREALHARIRSALRKASTSIVIAEAVMCDQATATALSDMRVPIRTVPAMSHSDRQPYYRRFEKRGKR